jgi:hypothetical protein
MNAQYYYDGTFKDVCMATKKKIPSVVIRGVNMLQDSTCRFSNNSG